MSFLHCPNCGVAAGDTDRSSTSNACPACGAAARRSLFRSSLPYRRFGRSADGEPEREAPEAERATWSPETGDAAGPPPQPARC